MERTGKEEEEEEDTISTQGRSLEATNCSSLCIQVTVLNSAVAVASLPRDREALSRAENVSW